MSNENSASLQDIVTREILNAATTAEKLLDAEIEKLERLDQDGIEKLREERLARMREEAKQNSEWIKMGHGTYEELPEEPAIFDVMKKSKNAVIHFFRNETPRCKIFDHHLKILAPKHIETRFVKLNAEKCPFLVERLQVKVLPLLIIAIDGKVKDRVVGFSDLGNKDDFSTAMLEWRIAQSGVIKYDGDLTTRPDEVKTSKKSNRTIRGREYDSDDSEDYI